MDRVDDLFRGGMRAGIGKLLVPIVFASAIVLSAVLFFWMELLFPDMILPLMGGTPATWITALMFYQAVLLLGYSYSYSLTRWATPRAQTAIHLTLLTAAALTLPPALPHTPAYLDAMPVLHVLILLTAGIGLPLFALAATAPLIQQYFSRTGHPSAGDPYFLYAASNAGSLAALVAYPVVVGPFIGHLAQTRLWTTGFLIAVGAIFTCAAVLRRTGDAPGRDGPHIHIMLAREGRRPYLWMLLAAVPSSLLSGTTVRITTDVAAGPLFWVIPFALYLSTFILAFSRRRILPLRFALLVQPLALAPVVITAFGGRLLIGDRPMVAWTLVLFFLTAYICHVRLADSRPGPAGTTDFYLMIALGGLAGGTFNALIAPNLFNDIIEYPLALVLAVALRPSDGEDLAAFRVRDVLLPCGAGLAAGLAIVFSPAEHLRAVAGLIGLFFSVGLIAVAASPARLASGLAVAFLLSSLPNVIDPPLYQERNFFGVLKVIHLRSADTNVLLNGTIVHGEQSQDPRRRREPIGYYHRGSPYSDVINVLAREHPIASGAVMGLGAGTIACSRSPQTRWTFYEVNPADVAIATDPRYFSYLAECAPQARILVGDGRLLLARERQKFDLIVLDAFSSDAVPTHLLTSEAFAIYLAKLRPDGMIVANISNRFVDLDPVLAAVSKRLGLAAVWRFDVTTSDLARPSKWVAMARTPQIVAPLLESAGWSSLAPAAIQPWTDDRSDLFGLLLWSFWHRIWRPAAD